MKKQGQFSLFIVTFCFRTGHKNRMIARKTLLPCIARQEGCLNKEHLYVVNHLAAKE